VAPDTGRTSAGAAAGVKRETVTLLAALVGAAALCGALATSGASSRKWKNGVAATIHPLWVDRAEFSRMFPEKVEAFSTAGMVMLKQSCQAIRQMMRFASDEVTTTVCATIEMSGCFSPVA
jgi:hypothetical protein